MHVYVCIYIHTYVYVCVCIYIYIYIYRQERWELGAHFETEPNRTGPNR